MDLPFPPPEYFSVKTMFSLNRDYVILERSFISKLLFGLLTGPVQTIKAGTRICFVQSLINHTTDYKLNIYQYNQGEGVMQNLL